MPTPLLVFTSDLPFGELIRQSLEETGRFNVLVTSEQETAAAYVRDFNAALAFLDTSLTENDLLKTGALLRQANPEIIFVVISETGWHSALEELFPRDYLSKPFYLPDLLEMMEKFFRSSLSAGNPSLKKKAGPTNDLPWLSDVTRAAQHLTRLTLESSAQAALITRDGQLWAYAGQLPQPAASEMANTLARYWDRQEENDLVRFVRLASTNAEHMLYATRLAESMVLALVFDAETPFNTIRSQASQLVHSLSTSPVEETLDEDAADGEEDMSSLSNILSNIPAPNPQPDLPAVSGYDFGTAASESRNKTNPGIGLSQTNSARFSRESPQAARPRPPDDTDQVDISPAPFDEKVSLKNNAPETDTVPEVMVDARSHPTTENARKIVLEPVSAAVYNLDYACMLVPRFPQHHLTGDLLDQLGEWILQICIAFGWRLEYISVRPDYLLWIVDVPPASSPSHLMRVFCQHTSGRIFEEFPRFKKENPSGDFWAPSYLIIGGSQPPPAQLIKDFIAQTRQRQGIPPQFNH
jgi:REP element-mobilizing transposase RayT/DNA-binding response OmpR family regulator